MYCAPLYAYYVLKISFDGDAVTQLTGTRLTDSYQYQGACGTSSTAMYCP